MKYIRDIHGEISIEDNFMQIVDHPLFQRLRRIKQLAFADFVYPSATHTRFSHSLGVFYISKIFNDELLSLYALIHDISHGPFSHAFESALRANKINYDHDEEFPKFAKEILQDSVFSYQELKRKIKEKGLLVSGDVGIDRQDYLIRDSYFTNVEIGYIHWQRLCRLMRIFGNKLYIDAKALNTVEHLFVARFLLGNAVYFHKTNLIIECMFFKTMKYLLEDYKVDELKYLDDFSLIKLIETNENANYFWNLIKNRKLYKMIYVSKNFEEIKEKFDKLEEEFQDFVIFGERKVWQKPIDILIEDKSLLEQSPLIKSLFDADKLRQYYFIAVHPEKIKEVKNLL